MASQMSRFRLRRGERGASAVEFALIAPVVLLLLMGTVSTGLVYNDHISLTNAAREGARYGAAADISSSSGGPTTVQTRVQQLYFNAAGTAPTDDQVCVKLVKADTSVYASRPRRPPAAPSPRPPQRHGGWVGAPCSSGCSKPDNRGSLGRLPGTSTIHHRRRVRGVLRPDGQHDVHRQVMFWPVPRPRRRGREWCGRDPLRLRSWTGLSRPGRRAGPGLRSRARGPSDRPVRCRLRRAGGAARFLQPRDDGLLALLMPVCARRSGTSRPTTDRFLRRHREPPDGPTASALRPATGASSVALRNKTCVPTNKATWAKWTWSDDRSQRRGLWT